MTLWERKRLTHTEGRTGRIGNHGLATSFYNDRDEDVGPELTKILLETKQEVPDFLQQFVPEEGADLKFEADSDFGDGDEAADGDAEAGDADADAGGGWGVAAESEEPAAASDEAWGVPEPAAKAAPVAATGGWGVPVPTAKVAPVAPAPAAAAPSGWGTGANDDDTW